MRISDKFIEKYGNYGGKITINLGAQSEKEAKDTVLTDPTAAADVFAFADDQLNELVQAGALQEVQLNADDIKSRNTPAFCRCCHGRWQAVCLPPDR